MSESFLIRGDIDNPYHVSVGGVLIENDKVLFVKKYGSGLHTLPRETVYANEGLISCVTRCFQNECGVGVKVEKYIGALITHFDRPSGITVEKCTLYFRVIGTGSVNKSPTDDEKGDICVWKEIVESIDVLKQQGNQEYRLIQRLST